MAEKSIYVPGGHDGYSWIPGIECLDVAEHFGFCLGCALKYIWRAGRKNPSKKIEDLEKAVFFIRREIAREENQNLDRHSGPPDSLSLP